MRDRRRPRRTVTLAVSVAVLCRLVSGSIFIPTPTSDTCDAASEYYDAAVLGCNSCGHPTGGATTPNSLLAPDLNDLNALGLAASCTCRKSAFWSSEDDSFCASTWPAPCNLDVCTSCPVGLVPSSDHTRCLPCGKSTLGVDAMTSDCQCAANSILLDKSETGAFLAAKECVKCANDTVGDSLTNQCTPCPDPAMTLASDARTGTRTCMCKAGHQLVTSTWLGVTKCLAKSRIAILNSKVTMNLASTVKFSDFSIEETADSSMALTFASDLVDDMFLLTASECYFYRNEKQIRFCQALGNLCVLQHLSPTAPPCQLFELIQKSGRATSANGAGGWFYTLPFLKYAFNARSVLESTRIGMKMSFDEVSNAGTHDHLAFVLATYTVNGTLKSFQRLSNQLLYCLDASVSATASSSSAIPLWTRFGVSTSSHFTCDLSTLDAANMELYELFLVDNSKPEGTNDRFVSVPVKNLNYADERGLHINQNVRASDAQDDFLSNRFFLFDVASGVQVGEKKIRVYRYANAIKLTIRTQSADPTALYLPVLTISYVETQTPSHEALIQFQVVYASDTSSFWSAATTIFSIACIIAGLRAVLHIFTWQRRNTRHEEMALTAWHSFLHLLTSLVSNFARACFVVLFLLCVYYLLFFKLQSSVFLLLPETNAQLRQARKDEYYPFRVMLKVAFTFQLATVLHRVYQQTQTQLFLIDWEKPRAKVIDVDSSHVQPAPVSIWRTILVANEWHKLQTARRTSLQLTLVTMLFLLYGCDLRSLALPIPRTQMAHMTTKTMTASTLTADEDLAMNMYLRFATVTSLWFVVCLVQRVWKWLLYERFFDEPREQVFVDLCTVAKVSCFIVDETYHGFYLHCRSPYPFADGTMSEIVEQLKQETAGLTVGRGLDGSMPECQTFEMFFTRRWKRKYLALYNAVYERNASRRTREDIGEQSEGLKQLPSMRGGRGRAGIIPWQPLSRTGFTHGWSSPELQTTQRMVEQAAELSDFLKSFVENQDDQIRWRIYRMETCLSRFFGIPPEMSATRQSFFLPDTNARFTRVVCLGLENDLMLLDMLCFTVFDLWFDNHAISALATYLLGAFVMALRSHFGSKSVSQTSLVDPRFLMK